MRSDGWQPPAAGEGSGREKRPAKPTSTNQESGRQPEKVGIQDPNARHVYVLRCGDGTLYTGIALDVQRRLAAHREGRGAKYTRGRGPLELVHEEGPFDHGDALRREREIKGLSRAKKLALIGEDA